MVLLTNSIINDVVILVVTSVTVLIFYVKYKYTYWSKRNVPFLPPTFLLGNIQKLLFQQTSIGEVFHEYHLKFEEQNLKYGGLYLFLRPSLIIIDPDIIKVVLTKNFNHFQNRFFLSDEKIDPISGQLFAAKIPKWRFLRTKLNPTFTSGKIKMMFPILVECGNHLQDTLEKPIRQKDPFDIKDILGRFTTDVIGSCAFGIDCNSLKDPDNEFCMFGKKVFDSHPWDVYKHAIAIIFPTIYRLLKFPLIRKEISTFFMNVTNKTVKYREQNNIERKDFLNLLIKLKNNENVEDEVVKVTEIKPKSNDPPFTMNDIAAQSFVFFIAGFETSSSTMAFCLYELCMNQEIQDKLRSEISETLQKYNGEITYEGIMEMPYMDKVVKETLRKYPIVPILPRQCTETFQIPDTNVVIEKDITIYISLLGMHRNPKYYPDPMKFDPERFSDKEKTKRHPYTYLPFGEGPRNCIGKRFGLMQTKVSLTILLKSYKFTVNQKTDPKMPIDKKSFVLAVDGGIWLNATKVIS